MTLVELKAVMYDLLVKKQNIEIEMQKVNNAIADYKEPVEPKDIPQG
jgi:hypothetical protein